MCPFKLCECPLGCGELVQRQLLQAHVDGPCPNRPATCPLCAFGCNPPGLTQGTLQAHIAEAAPQHVLLLASAMGAQHQALSTLAMAHAEMQGEAQALRRALAASEEERKSLRQEVAAALQQGDKQVAIDLKKMQAEVGEVRKQGATRAKEAGREKSELAAVRSELASLKSEHAKMAAALHEISNEIAHGRGA